MQLMIATDPVGTMQHLVKTFIIGHHGFLRVLAGDINTQSKNIK